MIPNSTIESIRVNYHIIQHISSLYSVFYLQPISNADFIVPVEIDNVIHQVYVLKRPYVDEFLCKMGDLFECVLFTASLAKVFKFLS